MRTELLSPAGDMRSAMQAIMNGADAIYLGGRAFGARAFAQNFSYEEMADTIALAHTYGVKAYVTVNTLVYQREAADFLRHTERVMAAGADALIMQDIGMILAVRRRYPDIAIHASTQMHNHSDAALKFAQQQGAVRAVLAREMHIEQIKALKCSIEKEVFIHGALCICYSGQCLMSARTQQRSGNRGVCAQSCRMRYQLVGSDGKLRDTQGSYLLSPKDLALFSDIGRLLDAGVGCFKIEGRQKSPEYVGAVTKIYAALLAQYHKGLPLKPNEADVEDLKKLFNRGFTKGHLLGASGATLMSKDRPNHRGTMLGRVVCANAQRITLKLDATLLQGDGIKFERSDDGFICNKIYRRGKLINGAEPGETVELDARAKVRAGDSVVKTSDAKLIRRLQKLPERQVPVFGRLTAKLGEPIALEYKDVDGHAVHVKGGIAQQSQTSPVSHDDLQSSVAKLGGTPYALESLEIDADKGVFVAKSALNAIRREAVCKLTQLRTALPYRRVLADDEPIVPVPTDSGEPLLHVLVRTEAQLKAATGLATGDIYTEDETLYFAYRDDFPPMRLKTDRMADEAAVYTGERLLVTDTGSLHVNAENNDIVADYFIGALNAQTVIALMQSGASRITLSPELDVTATAAMIEAYHAFSGQMPILEAVIWGRYELMAMRHCIISGALGEAACDGCSQQTYWLRDLNGKSFPVLTGTGCRSRIFESGPSCADADALRALGLRHFRVELFDEDAAPTKALLRRLMRELTKTP